MNSEIWTPATGALVTYCQSGDHGISWRVGYHDRQEDPMHWQEMARVNQFHAEPSFGTHVVMMRGRCDPAPLLGPVERHFTTYEELLAIPKLWSHDRITFASWIEEAVRLRSMTEATKRRLATTYAHIHMLSIDMPRL